MRYNRARYSTTVQSGPGAHSASHKIGTGFLAFSIRGIKLIAGTDLALRLKKE
jgi:hypothetical protein